MKREGKQKERRTGKDVIARDYVGLPKQITTTEHTFFLLDTQNARVFTSWTILALFPECYDAPARNEQGSCVCFPAVRAHTGLGKNCFSFSALGEAGNLTAAFKDWGKVEKVKKNKQLLVKTQKRDSKEWIRERETEQDLLFRSNSPWQQQWGWRQLSVFDSSLTRNRSHMKLSPSSSCIWRSGPIRSGQGVRGQSSVKVFAGSASATGSGCSPFAELSLMGQAVTREVCCFPYCTETSLPLHSL